MGNPKWGSVGKRILAFGYSSFRATAEKRTDPGLLSTSGTKARISCIKMKHFPVQFEEVDLAYLETLKTELRPSNPS